MADTLNVDVCVIGAGSGGLSVAAGASQMGASVVLLERGEIETAGVVLSRILGALYRHKPAGDPILAEAESIYGAYLAARGRRVEAEVCLRSALATLESIRGSETLPTRQARRRLEAAGV